MFKKILKEKKGTWEVEAGREARLVLLVPKVLGYEAEMLLKRVIYTIKYFKTDLLSLRSTTRDYLDISYCQVVYTEILHKTFYRFVLLWARDEYNQTK